MRPERDLFANFERMRREMDELFGDVFGPGLAGVDIDEIGLEIEGRELVLAGHRRPTDSDGRVYQQLEIDFGPFRRVIPLGADVVADQAKATYRDGILRVELPLAEPEKRIRQVPIEVEG